MATEDDAAEWRAIQDFPDYEVSDDGRVRRITQPRADPWKRGPVPYEIRPRQHRGAGRRREMRKPYFRVALYSPAGKRYDARVNRLVAQAFLPPPLPGETDASHEDGDSLNNRSSNLKWKPHQDNMADQRQHFTDPVGERNPRAKLTADKVRAIRARPDELLKDLAAEFGVTDVLISYIRSGKIWRSVT